LAFECGIRFLIEFFQKKTVTYVYTHLEDANFNSEFYKKYASQIVFKFKEENGKKIKLKKKTGNEFLVIFRK